MAKPANNENIERDETGPDFQGAIDLIRGKIRTNNSDGRSLAQDNATLYKRIDKQMGVHSGAAKDFAKIDAMAPEKRVDYLRSLIALLNFAGYDNFDDLVDRAQRPEGKGQRGGKSQNGAKAKAPDALDDGPEVSGGTESIDLKTGMVVGVDGEDIRQATPEELAAERDRLADFDDKGNVHPFPAGQKAN